ncbi:restriction endonuclease subunit S [Clostridium nigeriense]|uniref:restriction endonuclease subunit S n=1 Tax=Clostridium nigeriense TaxID=1805470 RepID=UPI003D327AC0
MSNNIPKLRFKGFNDEWKEQKLGDFLEFYSTNSLSRDCLNYKGGSIKNIHYGDIHMKFPVILDVNKHIIPFINDYIDTSKINKDSFCKDGDLVIADASEDYNDIGKAIEVENIGEYKVVAGLHTILARDNKKITARKFKGYMMLNEKIRKQIKILAAGAKVLGISKSNLAKVSVKLPSLEEQEKIAKFLNKVDKIIEKQEEKVSNLTSYKKGMMQKIFSQEIRFKDENGEEYPEWEEKKIGSLGETYTGLTGKTKDDFGFGNGKYITYMNVFKNTKIDLNMIEQVNIVENERQNNVEAGDLLFTTSSETPKEVGMVSVCNKSYENLYLNSFCFGFRLNNLKNINCEFMAYLMRSPKSRAKISILAQGSTRYNLSKTELLKMIIKIPCLEEQTKISNFFSNIDEILEKEKEKLEELRLWEKGLLQQMFV